MVLVEIFGLQIEASSGLPLVLLREVDEPHRILPIFIGGPEALAIARGLQGVTADRPLTHDLLVDLLERTGSRIDEVAVTELRDRTFIAELRLDGPTGQRVVSSRPSDAIALAVRVGAPVYASEDVLDEAGAVLQEGPLPDEPEESIEEAVEEFREFLEQLNPADFQGTAGRAPGEARTEALVGSSDDDADEDPSEEEAVLWVEGEGQGEGQGEGEGEHDHDSNGDVPPHDSELDDDENGNGSPR